MTRRRPPVGSAPPVAAVDASVIAGLFAAATGLHRAGRLAEAEQQYRRILDLESDHAPALARLGGFALQQGDAAAALALLQRAIACDGKVAEFHHGAGLAQERLGRLDSSLASYRRAVALAPDSAPLHSDLGFLQRRVGRIAEAVKSFRKAASLEPALALNHLNLGMALEELGTHEEALACFRTALACDPHFAQAHLALGNVLEARGELAEALAQYQRAAALQPQLAVAHLNLGNALAMTFRLADAEASFRRALGLRPDYAEARHNLANTLREQGRLDEACAEFEHALAARPDHIDTAMHLASNRLYQPQSGLAELQQAAERCAERILAAVTPMAPAPRRAAEPMPRLGFLSGDFRVHAAGILVLPTLEALAKSGRRFVCYNNSRRGDALTDRFRAASAHWREVAGLPDRAVADRIRDDRIDILFDLSGYTAGNRLLALARKPAPIQIGWAGYPATTGLAAIDYLLADRHQIPDGADRFYREAILRMPDSYICHVPPEDAPEPGALPAGADGALRFGSFNVLKKISPPVIAAWAGILRHLPDATLLIKATALDCLETRARTVGLFAAQGVAAERLVLLGSSSRAEHMRAMLSVDIALDCFPYSGGVTSLEALWMGLPVITLPGETLASRHSLSYLAAIGLGELVADSVESYVGLAIALAADRARLAALRAGLRARMRASPLCDCARFTAAFTAACATIWQRHLAGEPPRSFTVGVESSPGA